MADFTRYEYEEQVARMTEILRDAPGWGDGYDSTMGQTLIQLMADVTDNLHFMLERRTIENYIITAKLRSSIITRASEMGYRLIRRRANSGYVRIELRNNNGDTIPAIDDVVIPILTPLSSTDGVNYVLAEDLVIKAGDAFGDVLVKQAQSVSETLDITAPTFIDGNYIVIGDYENIENDLFFVSADSEIYYDVTKSMTQTSPARRALSFATPDDAYYDLRYTVEGMRLIFGDGTFGKKPASNIIVNYANVTNLDPLLVIGNDFSFASTEIFDIGANQYAYTAQNITQIRGGSDAESNESIKNNAIAYNQTNGRAVTNPDYEFWTRQSGIGNIIDARVAGENELDSLVYNINNVYITYLTALGDAIVAQDRRDLETYFSTIKMSGDHLVFKPADILRCRANIWPVRTRTLPISDAELYGIIYRFVTDYFALSNGSIGREIQQSDIIDALYDLRVTRSGIEYRVIDFVRLDLDAVYPFSAPAKTNDIRVRLSAGYTPTNGDEFILLVDEVPVVSNPTTGQNYEQVLLDMRDAILAQTNVRAGVRLNGVMVDNFGYPVPFGLSGESLAYTYISVISTAPNVEILRRYFGGTIGSRDLVPVGEDTVVAFTAPADSDVIVKARVNIRNAATEVVLGTVTAGNPYTFTNTGGTYQSIQLEFVSESTIETQLTTTYPAGAGTQLELRVQTLDGFGEFNLSSVASSDVDAFVSFHYNVSVPKKTRIITETTRNIMDGTLSIITETGDLVATSNEAGDFFDPDGVYIGGFVDHRSGEIELPDDLPIGDYLFVYKQDMWQNLKTDEFAAIQLIAPKPTIQSAEFSLSKINLE